ncbi:cinnamyl-alcohol dehydrogenase [Ranunculus cassubicifolius]
MHCSPFFLLALVFYTILLHFTAIAANPTDGFSSLPLTGDNLDVQKPYDKSISQRYSFINGVHKLWVYSNDNPHTPTSNTQPRYGYVPSGTTGVSIMQVFGASPGPTTLMMKVYGGSLNYYSKTVVEPNIYDRWFRLNVIHDVDASKLQVFIDGVLKKQVDGKGRATHYFKFGVYAQPNASHYMESQWKGIKVLKKM